MKKSISLVFLVLSAAVFAQAGLPLMKHLAGDRELPKPFGISLDFFGMDQPYAIDQLFIDLPDLILLNTDGINVDNEVTYYDLKADAWILPFMNVFAVVGNLDGDTHVDFNLPDISIPLTTIDVSYDGFVYGGGVNLTGGGEHFFAALTATYTNTDLSGDFKSSVKSLTLQPRVGYHSDWFEVWAGGLILDAEEKHRGNLDFPFFGAINFDVALSEKESWNTTLGGKVNFNEHWSLLAEIGFGDRDSWLATVGYRF